MRRYERRSRLATEVSATSGSQGRDTEPGPTAATLSYQNNPHGQFAQFIGILILKTRSRNNTSLPIFSREG